MPLLMCQFYKQYVICTCYFHLNLFLFTMTLLEMKSSGPRQALPLTEHSPASRIAAASTTNASGVVRPHCLVHSGTQQHQLKLWAKRTLWWTLWLPVESQLRCLGRRVLSTWHPHSPAPRGCSHCTATMPIEGVLPCLWGLGYQFSIPLCSLNPYVPMVVSLADGSQAQGVQGELCHS